QTCFLISGHPKLKNISILSRVIEGVPKKCGKQELVNPIKNAIKINPDIFIICSITGTDDDPQNRVHVKRELENAGAIVMPSNASASKLTGYLIKLMA
ncbi:MAG: hypothetical protein HGB12_07335, partial [Bacteroidetes bacterium]|nr:hypothetical protein [Bacteroidota bacterium]